MRRALPLAALLLAACANDEEFSGTFDTPAPVGVLHPTVDGPFTTSVGYAADRHGGRIRLLDLDRGRYLADAPFASFYRGRALPTGAERLLTAVAPVAPDDSHVHVWAADKRFRELVRVTHVDGRDDVGNPIVPRPVLTAQRFVGADGSGSAPSLQLLLIDGERATTEDWTVTWDGTRWQVQGSRSGDQGRAFPGVVFTTRDRALRFVVEGDATVGDRFELSVDRQTTSVPLDGVPLDMSLSPDQSSLVVLRGTDTDAGTVVEIRDPLDGTLTATAALPPGAEPLRVAWTAEGDQAFLADGALPAVHVISPTGDLLSTIDLPWSVTDVAHLAPSEDEEQLFLVPRGLNEVWVLDPNTRRFVDVNAATPEVEGMRFLTQVRGLAAIQEPYEWPTDILDDEGEDFVQGPTGRTVAVSLLSGKIVFMREGDGCLVDDGLGPRTELQNPNPQVGDYEPYEGIQIPGTAYLQPIEDPSRHVVVAACAGVAQQESWQLRYEEPSQGWVVTGSVSGEQATLAREDERYVSDEGAISFVMRAGTNPSQDGWSIQFNVIAGILQADGDNEGDGVRELAFDLPGRPAIFWADDEEGERRPWVVAAAESADVVVKINTFTGEIPAIWD